MKQLKKYIVVLCGALTVGLGGCNDFLDIYDPAVVTPDYYDTKEGQEKLVVNLYARYRSVFTTYVLQYLGTDMYISCDESPAAAQFNGYNADLSGLSGTIDTYWATLYKIVQEANILLARCTPEIAGRDYDRLVAKGRILRAMAYYYLVETFGGVPLLTGENTAAGDVIGEVTRAGEEEIYRFIVAELEASLGKLPEKAEAAGELSDTALKHLLGKIYLTRAYRDYARPDDAASAVGLFEEVIASTHYGLLPRFGDVFDENNQNNKEIIWAIQYGTDKNYNGSGNPIHTQFGFNITALYPGMFALDQQEYSSMMRNIWTNPRVHEWFRHPAQDSRYEATFRFEFAVNDPTNERYGQTGIYMPHWDDTSGDDRGAVHFYPFRTASGDYNWYPALGMMGWSTDCMPMCRKFRETKIEWGGKGTREDAVIRMADTYLLLAEAYLLAGRPDAALEKVNAILRRAAGSEENYEVLKIASASELTLDRLLEERGCELFGEHDRWFDLKRTGTLLARARLNPLVEHYDNLSEKHLVRPIPYNERIKLKGLSQNEGYNN